MGVGGADETRSGKCGVGGSVRVVMGGFYFHPRSPGASGRAVQGYMKERGKDIISLLRFPRVF